MLVEAVVSIHVLELPSQHFIAVKKLQHLVLYFTNVVVLLRILL